MASVFLSYTWSTNTLEQQFKKNFNIKLPFFFIFLYKIEVKSNKKDITQKIIIKGLNISKYIII